MSSMLIIPQDLVHNVITSTLNRNVPDATAAEELTVHQQCLTTYDSFGGSSSTIMCTGASKECLWQQWH